MVLNGQIQTKIGVGVVRKIVDHKNAHDCCSIHRKFCKDSQALLPLVNVYPSDRRVRFAGFECSGLGVRKGA